MSIRISDFKRQIQNIARPNRFMVEFHLSPELSAASPDLLRGVQFHVQSAKIPERNVGEIPIPFHGMSLKLPGDYQHDDLTITFLNQLDWKVRNFFESWNEQLHSVKDSLNTSAYGINVLQGSFIIVHQLGNFEEQVTARYKYMNVFPKNVGEIALSMDTNDSPETYDVIWSYTHFERLSTTATTAAKANIIPTDLNAYNASWDLSNSKNDFRLR
jgi:hypothetical protein